MIGSRIAHYEITAKFGEGGMGVVYRARDTKLGRDVAIKVLPDAFARDGARMERFRREARTLASLNHPNIAAIYGIEEAGGAHAIVMELAAGEMLADRLGGGAIPIEDALPIARQIAEALAAAHDKGIIHRDLKPANIMLTGDGMVKIVDFGIGERAIGNPAYFAPEELRGEQATPKTDQYRLAAVTYQLCTGRKPFEADSVESLFYKILIEPPPAPMELNPALTPEVGEVLAKGLAKKPTERFARCTEFVEALRAAWS